MQIAAVLEISPDSSGAVPAALLGAAYRASAVGYVVLVLRGVTPQSVDRALDPLVSSSRNWRLNGVIYADAADEKWLCSAAQRAQVVMVSSDQLRAAFLAKNIPHLDSLHAIERLAELERGVGVTPPLGAKSPSALTPNAIGV